MREAAVSQSETVRLLTEDKIAADAKAGGLKVCARMVACENAHTLFAIACRPNPAPQRWPQRVYAWMQEL